MAIISSRRLSRIALASALAAAVVPASVASQSRGAVQPFSEAERRQGAEAHTQIMQEFGGAYDGPQAAYVRSVGQNVAVQSGLSSARTDFTVTLLNSPVNNAFALPGGYVYATRQLMALMNNEAELAGVLAHEIGHSAARHSRQRQSRATRNSIIGVLATVLGGAIGDNGGILGGIGGFLQNNAMQAAQLATLSFSRSQETEADDLGIRYINGAGYDPAALSTMLASLAAQNSLDARAAGRDARSVPEWASTHPDPASRVRRALDRARALNVGNGRLNRDVFLNQINNVMYADDPRQGVIEGQDFIHPDLRLRFTVPQGFAMSNGTSAVAISGNSGQGQFSTAAYQGDLDAYVRAVFQGIAGQNQQNVQLGPVSRTTINGLRTATASVRTTSGQRSSNGQAQQIDLTIVAYEFSPTQAFHFATITPAGQSGVFSPLYQSLRRISDAEARAVRPRRVQVVTVRRGDTVESLAARMAFSTLQRERFLVLNALTEGAALTPGQRVKIVVYASS